MNKRVLIDEPGAGTWIMQENEGVFRTDLDHSIANYGPDGILGGFVVCNYLGASVCIHQAGTGPGWCTRKLLATLFHYVFSVLKCHKAFGPVPSDNYHALEICLRGGWKLETVIKDALAPGRHILLLGMEAGNCPWLRITLR